MHVHFYGSKSKPRPGNHKGAHGGGEGGGQDSDRTQEIEKPMEVIKTSVHEYDTKKPVSLCADEKTEVNTFSKCEFKNRIKKKIDLKSSQ